MSRELKKKKNSRSTAYEVLANIQRLKGGCCLESGRFRGSKKEGGAPRSIFAYELRAISDLEISPPVNIFDGDVTRIIENLISLRGKFVKFLYIYE